MKQQIKQLKVIESFEWFKYIENHPEKSWNYDEMCGNPNVTWELIQAFPDIFVHYINMCSNINITWT